MNLLEADALFATPARIEALAALIDDSEARRILLPGLRGSAPALLFAALPARKHPYIIVADDLDDAGYIYHDLCQTAGADKVAIFTSGYRRDIKYGQVDPPSQILRTETLDAWSRKDHPLWVVTYPEALAETVPSKKGLADNTLTLTASRKCDMHATCVRLRELGFREVDYVYEPGQFAVRGSILDVYSYSGELPYRIDFFDDEIDTIRAFNVETQLSEKKLKSVSIIPANPAGAAADKCSLLEFTDPSTPVFCRSFLHLESRIKAIAEETISENVAVTGEGDVHAMENVVNPELFIRRLESMKRIEFPSVSSESIREEDIHVLPFSTSLQALYHKNFNLIAESLTKFIDEGYRILILSDTPYQTDRLKAIFEDRGDKIQFTPVSHTIHEGFVDHDRKICFFTDHQIFDRFHKYNLKSDRARGGKLALSLKELQQIEAGDYIVHIDHGIARFGGLVKTDVNGHPQEMIKLLFQNDDIVLVSIHALHKLSKYRGKEGVPPKISKLGSGAWQKLKDRTKSKMKDIARDLIRLYAARREEKGFAFAPDSYLQHELEASFIYEDTPDQLKATQDVKADMESARPMDRLICGDVGFGKTEIAIRAAFKAACDSKQTAVLVPTTVLAMQHYHTFRDRLKDLPVRVEFISRAKKPKEVKQILADLAEGKVDIIIGTHKLIGKSVKFKDLGLLIVDEEQKFGVAVKEKLKQLKVNVDTLTMSATPIPRTLQFSLMGARDLSSLNTPPPTVSLS